MNYYNLQFQVSSTLALLKSAKNFLIKIQVKTLKSICLKAYRLLKKFDVERERSSILNTFKILFTVNFVLKVAKFYFENESYSKAFQSVFSNKIKFFKLKAVTSSSLKKKNLNIKNFNLKNRVDITLRLLAPSVKFFLLKKNYFNFNFFFSTYLVWPGECLDILVLLFKSNPFFINTKLLDSSIFFSNYKGSFTKVMYYIFKIPLFSTLLVVFFNLSSNVSSFSKKLKVISLESAFKSMSWIERESSELFGFFFFGKKNNRKLVTDYFLKIYPMLKWVPSVGFSELAISAEGVFILRSVKVQNLSLA